MLILFGMIEMGAFSWNWDHLLVICETSRETIQEVRLNNHYHLFRISIPDTLTPVLSYCNV
jgi:hypothetical protein